MLGLFGDPSTIDLSLDSRSISFENPTGGRGAGGTAAHGRKGSPSRMVQPGETVVLADIDGPGRIRHIWLTIPKAEPVQMRSVILEGFYDGMAEPSISVPMLDFFGLPNGRPAAYFSALTSVAEGRGYNAYFPMPFRSHLRLQLSYAGKVPISLFYQIDYTLEPFVEEGGYLHVSFRRENPTTQGRDFVIATGLKGPGRFLGSAIGVRPKRDEMMWYGEGEFKVYRDGDSEHPTICGTGLEDYIGSAWGLGPHAALYAGAPVIVARPKGVTVPGDTSVLPDFVSFYRWHLPDAIVFRESLKVTIQQIGLFMVKRGEEQQIDEIASRHTIVGGGVQRLPADHPFAAVLLAERTDDYSAAAFVYCRQAQGVARVDAKAAAADIGFRQYESL